MRRFLLSASLVLTHLVILLGQQTTIVFDRGEYGFDYSDLKEIKWSAKRTFQIAINETADADLLQNISVEVNRELGDELAHALAIRKHKNQVDSLSQDSFKLQPFDAVYAEYVCKFKKLEVGDTIEISYTIKSEPSTNIIRWQIQQAYPVVSSTFEFLIPEVAAYNDHLTDGQYLVSETLLDTTFVFERARVPSKGIRFTFKNIPAHVDEPFAPDPSETQAALLFSISDLLLGDVELYMPSWSNQVTDLIVGDYFGKQFRVRSSYRWLVEKAIEILNTKYTEELMVLKLYEFVHQEFQWDGTYGLFPSQTLNDMIQIKSVNKASMNMALLALLQEAGFKAYPVLVSTTDQPFVYEQIPNINQFNHFVIALEQGKDLTYLDAGDELLPPGLVDSGVRHTNAILIKNYKGSWHTIPDDQSKSTILVDMKVHGDLSASGTISASFEGYDAHNERYLLQADGQALYWKERASAISPDIRIDSVRFENVRNLLKPFNNRVFFHIEPSQDQEEMAFFPVFYSFFNQEYFTDTLRINRIVFPTKLFEQFIFNVSLDPGLKIESLPENLRLRMIDSSSEAEFRGTSSQNMAQCIFSVSLNNRIIEPVYYTALKTYMDQIALKLSQPVVIARN
ncbi:MAG: hypothetical protein KDC53_08685 [Saprospiraceae bacterium]|nr:hypothetical protein [Saprospiraceae bacterium]